VANECPKCQTNNPEDSKFCKECATPLPENQDIVNTKTIERSKEKLTTGSIFAGRYQIIDELGKGGMGRVYKVLDKETKEKIALKLIKPEIASDKKTIERFRNELTTARKISQRNVCRMYDLNKDKDSYYITMEYVPGEDLKSLIRRVKVDIGTSIKIAKQICEGLSEAHRTGVVHRDLKPSNIMIDKNGDAKIMDFGIARTVRGKGITGSGVMIGTPEYMSPEQAEAKEIDHRSDIYSLGVIMYEMTTGQLPFEGETPLSIAMKHKGEMPKNPKELNPQIPEDLTAAILECLAKEKESRFQSAEELRSQLMNIEKGISSTDRTTFEKKALTSREITVSFKVRRLLIPLVLVAAAAIVGLILWSPWKRQVSAPIPESKQSVAVLPFEDLSEQQDQGYLCYGLSESIINALSQIKDLRVPAPNSSSSLVGKELPLREIGEKLNVEAVFRGSIQKAGDRVRILAQLINVMDESIMWSQAFNRKTDDLFAIQDEISLEIVDRLQVSILGGEKEGLVKRYTENSDAYNLFLNGIYFWNKRTLADIRKAIAYFEQAVEADPDYALAYARLSDSYGLLPFYSATLPKDAFDKARSAVFKALEIDYTLPEAHSALGFIKFYYDWDWEEAEKEFKWAVQAKPSYVTAHHWYAEYLTCMGRHEEAIEEVDRALEYDPLSLVLNQIKAVRFYYARRYDDTIVQCQKALELDPNFLMGHWVLGMSYLEKGLNKEAIALYRQSLESPTRLGYVYAKTGNREAALEILEEMKELWMQEDLNASSMAFLYSGLGEVDMALEWLEKAFERRETRMTFLKVHPMYDSLRQHPRFHLLLKKMNLD